MKMRVLNVAYPFASVGPAVVGGAEQVLTQLDSALVRNGHESLVLASEGSRTAGRLFSFSFPAASLSDELQRAGRRIYREVLAELVRHLKPDLVHFHGIDFLDYLPQVSIPCLATLHLPLSWYPETLFSAPPAPLWMHCVSRSQQSYASGAARLLPVIENGVDLRRFRPGRHHGRYALSLSRICPEKGLHLALDAAEQSSTPYLLAGKVYPYPSHVEYFETQVVPRLGRTRRFIGPPSVEKKIRLLQHAGAVLIPSLAPETSSLVAMEALACGTPVIAFATGALPEIVENGKTGFIVHSATEMAEALKNLKELDLEQCRRHAEEKFSLDLMTSRYLRIYADLIEQSRANGESLQAVHHDSSFRP